MTISDDPFATFIEWDGENDQVFNDLVISSHEEHAKALSELDKLWQAEKGTPEFRKLLFLVDLIVAYESKEWPIEEPTREAFEEFCFDQRIFPYRPTSPAEIIKEEFISDKFPQTLVQQALGFSESDMEKFLSGLTPITSDIADKLSGLFGTSKELWINLQNAVDKFDQRLPPFEVKPLSEEDGGGYLISFPDYPGCIADGKTVGEAIEEGKDALKAYMLSQKHLINQIDQNNLPESFDDGPMGKEKL